MTHGEVVLLCFVLAIGCIAACALMGRLDDPAPGDRDH